MCGNSREEIIAKYTDKSRYKPEYIYGDVYVDEERVKLSKSNKVEKEKFETELNTAKRFSDKFGFEIFMLPPKDGNKNIYIDKESNPDTISFEMFVEIKNPSGSETSIKTRFRESVHKADGVLLSVEKNISVSQVKKWITNQLNWMNNHDGFLVAIEVGTENNRKYGVFKINGKELSLGSFPEKPRLQSPLKQNIIHTR